jgi:hypothetical protein
MYDATQSNPADQHPNGRPACPSWCVEDSEFDGTSVLHYGQEHAVAGLWVRLTRCDFIPAGVVGEVEVGLTGNGEVVPLSEVAELSSVLGRVMADVLSDDGLIIRLMDLPEGLDVVVYRDINVVAVSSRLDEDTRNRVLIEAGVR